MMPCVTVRGSSCTPITPVDITMHFLEVAVDGARRLGGHQVRHLRVPGRRCRRWRSPS